jgi:hypothetical protein
MFDKSLVSIRNIFKAKMQRHAGVTILLSLATLGNATQIEMFLMRLFHTLNSLVVSRNL